MINIYKSKNELTLQEIAALPKSNFSYSVNPILDLSPNFSIVLSPRTASVSYEFKKSLNHDEGLSLCQFQPELWRKDVLELFISSDLSETAYQELNFSPTGAYWQARFTDYRDKIIESEAAVENIQIELKQQTELTILTTQIPRGALNRIEAGCRINCCSIFGSNPRSYYSSAKLDSSKIDFHIVKLWPEVQFVDL